MRVERVQSGVRLEKRLLKTLGRFSQALKRFAEAKGAVGL